jgi:hypothetical protein
MKSEVYKIKVNTRDWFIARILDATDRTQKREIHLRRTIVIFVDEFQSTLRVTMSFSNICYEL